LLVFFVAWIFDRPQGMCFVCVAVNPRRTLANQVSILVLNGLVL